MKDAQWCKGIEDEISDLKRRLNKLEGNSSCSNGISFETDIEWPEADIGGLHFNAQKTHAVFEFKDGKYYSRDILFNSARDTDKGTGRDLLSEYLESEAVKKAFATAIADHGISTDNIHVFLPKTNQGEKKYNGVSWWYWLKPRSSGSSSNFTYVIYIGYSNNANNASSVGGCAPAFCVA